MFTTTLFTVPIRHSRIDAARYDQSCTQDYGLPAAVLMTHAAVECAAIIRRELAGKPGRVVAVCGAGNNGGDGYAIVRTLHSHGVDAIALEVARCPTGCDADLMREAARAMGLVYAWDDRQAHFAQVAPIIIIDAIFGTGLSRAPAGAPLDAIHWINAQSAKGCAVYAIDLPSGLDCDRGQPLGAADDAVVAHRTLTMVCAKVGFDCAAAQRYIGIVSEISIGGPPLTQQRPFVE